jgi:hypothetical protein
MRQDTELARLSQWDRRLNQRPHSSSASRRTAGEAGFLTLPSHRSARSIARAEPLAHDPLGAELAGVQEDFRAVAVYLLA